MQTTYILKFCYYRLLFRSLAMCYVNLIKNLCIRMSARLLLCSFSGERKLYYLW